MAIGRNSSGTNVAVLYADGGPVGIKPRTSMSLKAHYKVLGATGRTNGARSLGCPRQRTGIHGIRGRLRGPTPIPTSCGLQAHNLKVVGSNPAPATIDGGRPASCEAGRFPFPAASAHTCNIAASSPWRMGVKAIISFARKELNAVDQRAQQFECFLIVRSFEAS
jgi:hypothetical protein